jgi:hypothetical protein
LSACTYCPSWRRPHFGVLCVVRAVPTIGIQVLLALPSLWHAPRLVAARGMKGYVADVVKEQL